MNLGLKLKLLSRQDVHLILPLGLHGGLVEGKDTRYQTQMLEKPKKKASQKGRHSYLAEI